MERDANGKILPWECPRCGKTTVDYPALSRTDNKTNICSQCGTDEAMENWARYIQSQKEQE